MRRTRAKTALMMNHATPRIPLARPGRPKMFEKKIMRSILKALIEAMAMAKPFVCLFMYGRCQQRKARKAISTTNTAIT